LTNFQNTNNKRPNTPRPSAPMSQQVKVPEFNVPEFCNKQILINQQFSELIQKMFEEMTEIKKVLKTLIEKELENDHHHST
jgi:hypothetical protein